MTKKEKLSKIHGDLMIAIAEEKAKKAAAEADYYKNVHDLQRSAQEMREAVYDEPEEEHSDKPTVWLDGHQHTAVITARRILCKLPPIPRNCAVDISLSRFTDDGINLSLNAYNPHRVCDPVEEGRLKATDVPEKQAADTSGWLERATGLLSYKHGGKEADNE